MAKKSTGTARKLYLTLQGGGAPFGLPFFEILYSAPASPPPPQMLPDNIGSRMDSKWKTIRCENFNACKGYIKKQQKFVSILNVPFGKITHNLTVYLQCMDCKNTILEKQDVCSTQRAWTWGLLQFHNYSPQMHSNCGSYCYWFT